MAPRWPQMNDGPEHINEHATYLREACNQLQAVGRAHQALATNPLFAYTGNVFYAIVIFVRNI